AMRQVGRAVAAYERLVRAHPENVEFRSRLARCLESLGIQQERAGHPEAATSFERVVAIREALARDHPTSLRYRTGLSWGHINLAIARAKAGRPAEALVNLRKAEQLIGRLPHNDPNTLCKLACAYAQCGAAARRGGRDLSPTDLAELQTCADRAL